MGGNNEKKNGKDGSGGRKAVEIARVGIRNKVAKGGLAGVRVSDKAVRKAVATRKVRARAMEAKRVGANMRKIIFMTLISMAKEAKVAKGGEGGKGSDDDDEDMQQMGYMGQKGQMGQMGHVGNMGQMGQRPQMSQMGRGAAEYGTPKNSLNQISLWDGILPTKEHAKFWIHTSNKYRFIDQGTNLRGKEFNLTLHWHVMPKTGKMFADKIVMPGYRLPQEYR
ncbi:hypothetical protein ACFX1Q_033401 [Malus domestica]